MQVTGTRPGCLFAFVPVHPRYDGAGPLIRVVGVPGYCWGRLPGRDQVGDMFYGLQTCTYTHKASMYARK